jgi:hypothetical protein
MGVVVDASIDPRLVEAFVGDDVRTLFDLGWQQLKDNLMLGHDARVSLVGGFRRASVYP